MLTISDVVHRMSYYDEFLSPCIGCGVKPRFLYCDTCTPESIIRIDHKCTTPECKRTQATVSLLTIHQMIYADVYINELLSQMVNDWNGANPYV